jgi:decaprenyl-phosphate phosphoribosyltransferase
MNIISKSTIKGHLAIMRMDHWIKHVFVVPGVLLAFIFLKKPLDYPFIYRLFVGIVAICILSSSYYTLNEVLDAPYDRMHPTKCNRPVALGLVREKYAYLQWLFLGGLGLYFGFLVNIPTALTLLFLWCMGCAYNIPPVRLKDLQYLDVISESINNPLRMLIGWFILDSSHLPPLSFLLFYWCLGAYFMAIKRFAEFREIGDPIQAALYRKSFKHYNEQRLLTSVIFYGSSAMLFLGAFSIRYRLELFLSYPFLAFIMAIYFDISFKQNSATQAPEKLYNEPLLMVSILIYVLLVNLLLFIDVPWLHNMFTPTLI